MIRILNTVLLASLAGLFLFWQFRDELTPADRKILFIGNSYLFVEDVPNMVKQLGASSANPIRYHTRMVAFPNARLIEHQKNGEAAAEIRTGIWDTIVLQDQSGTAFSQDLQTDSQQAIAYFADLAQEAGSDLIFYAHWPPEQIAVAGRNQAVTRIEEMYNAAAQRHGGKIAPIGAVWQTAWASGMTGLYDDDLHHASRFGAYTAALTLFEVLGDRSVMDADWMPNGITTKKALQIRGIVGRLDK